MKKLLLLTNLVCICFLFASCQNAQKPKTENNIEVKQVINDSIIAKDTTKVASQSAVSGTVGNDKSAKKDTTIKPIKTTAIIHKAPEQDKIDSIKNVKTKNKK